LAELQTQFICGGISDKDFPQVIPEAESIMTLDEVLDALKSAPTAVLRFSPAHKASYLASLSNKQRLATATR
jgi:hypothetical protein